MASRLQDVISRGLAAAKPLATLVAPGTLYYSTDAGITERSNGTIWETYTDGGAAAIRFSSIEMIIDGGASVLTTGLKGFIEIPFTCTIKQVTLLADVSGSIVIDLWKDTYTNYPPTIADTIVASAPPTITSALKSQDLTLTGWNTALVAGDILAVNVNSVTSIKRIVLSLKVQS